MVTNQSEGTVSVLLNTSTGSGSISFSTQTVLTVGNGPTPIAVADINGDGKPDLIIGNGTDNTISVLINTTAKGSSIPSFSTQQTFAVGKFPDSIAVADFNGDGRPDIAVTDNNDSTLYVFENTTANSASSASLGSPLVLTTGLAPRAVTAADFDSNGSIDLAVSSNGQPNAIQVYSNTTGKGSDQLTFSAQPPIPVDASGNPVSMATADFNGDGFPDIVIANNTSAADNFGILLGLRNSVTLTTASATGTILATVQPLSFTAVSGAAQSSAVTSNTVTVSGISYSAPISINGGQYSIGGGAFTSANGTVSSGQTIQLSLTSSASASTPSSATVTVGGVPASFTVTTASAAPTGGSSGGGGAAELDCIAFLAAGALLRRRRRKALTG